MSHSSDSREKDVRTIITLTGNAPQGLNGSLSSLSLAAKPGLFGSSTPFVTGRPYTLSSNDSVTYFGAVGIAFSAGRRPALQTMFPGLPVITPPLIVTGSKGDLVNEMNNRNPTALLVSAAEKSALSGNVAKEDEFYLRVLRDGELWQVQRIMFGDPSRGSMVLETETVPREGAFVQLFHCPNDAAAPSLPFHATKNSLTFVTAPQFELALAGQGEDTATVVHDAIALT